MPDYGPQTADITTMITRIASLTGDELEALHTQWGQHGDRTANAYAAAEDAARTAGRGPTSPEWASAHSDAYSALDVLGTPAGSDGRARGVSQNVRDAVRAGLLALLTRDLVWSEPPLDDQGRFQHPTYAAADYECLVAVWASATRMPARTPEADRWAHLDPHEARWLREVAGNAAAAKAAQLRFRRSAVRAVTAGVPKVDVAAAAGISRPTLDSWLADAR